MTTISHETPTEADKANSLLAHLEAWVLEKELNGISQHSAEWLHDKLTTIGGSSLATLQGLNPFSSKSTLIKEKIGLDYFHSSIKPQWGNLFEDVIKEYVEKECDCIILGENLYVPGKRGTAYSPDGLTVVDVDKVISNHGGVSRPQSGPEITLIEFKCPFSRVPSGKVPVYYLPQVKMGLDLLELPTRGLFIEAVFRRCSIGDLAFNSSYDISLIPKRSGDIPLACGVIGFRYQDPNGDNWFKEKYPNLSREDFGVCSPDMFTDLMSAYDSGYVQPWYSPVLMKPDDLNVDYLAEFNNKYTAESIGVLCWKLQRVYYTSVDKTQGYLDEWYPVIESTIDIVRQCLSVECMVERERLFDKLIYQDFANNDSMFDD